MKRYVEIPKKVHCPKWDIDLVLLGKYYLSDDINLSFGKFQKAKCPIVENSELPLYEQQKEYKLLRCLGYLQCPLLKEFPEEIDTKKVSRID